VAARHTAAHLSAPAVGYAAALGVVGLITVAVAALGALAPGAHGSTLYLIGVLFAATRYGRGPAVVAALVSALAYDYFLVEPVHTFAVANADEWLTLGLLLITAVVTGGLATELRRRAAEAEGRRREAVALHTLGQLIFGQDDPEGGLPAVAEHLRGQLGARGVSIAVADAGGELVERAVAGDGAAASPDERADAERAFRRGEAIDRPAVPTGHGAGAAGRRLVPLRAGEHVLGVLRVVTAAGGGPVRGEHERLISAAATQIALMLERARLRAEATDAEVLRRSDGLKSALLSSVSHDLRTPLAAIKAAAGSFSQSDVDWSAEERRGFAGAIEREVDRLNRIVGNLLDVSRIEAGALHPRKELFPLGAIVDEVVARLHGSATGHVLTVDVADDLPPLPLDYVQIDQVLTNLIENALRHTPPGTPIAVSARREGEQVRVSVVDRGPGVPPTALGRLFEKFYRFEGRPGERPRGTGLGLAVAKGLVEAHGGRIWVESAPGAGTAFHFTLPLAAELAATAV
jgi:two-component system sensor histidine kinase KdpD